MFNKFYKDDMNKYQYLKLFIYTSIFKGYFMDLFLHPIIYFLLKYNYETMLNNPSFVRRITNMM